MLQIGYKEIKRNFRIDEEALNQRVEVAHYIRSFSAMIVDRLMERLARDEAVRHYFTSVKMTHFKRLVGDFLCDLYSLGFDQQLIDRIEYVGRIHHTVNLLPEHLSQGFDQLREVILELASVNQQVAKDLNIILKMLHIAEFIMNETYYGMTTQEKGMVSLQNEQVSALEMLFEISAIHKRSFSYLKQLHGKKQDAQLLKQLLPNFSRSSELCGATPIYRDLLERVGELENLSVDIVYANEQHGRYHELLDSYLEALESGDAAEAELDALYTKIETTYQELVTPLEGLVNTRFDTMALIVNSAIQFINATARKLQIVNPNVKEGGSTAELEQALRELFINNFGWCIEEVYVSRFNCADERFRLKHEIGLKAYTLHISLELKKGFEYDLLNSLIVLILENVRNILTYMEREKSLEALAVRAEEANQAKDMFLANMSHELRTPLNAIIGFSQILGAKKDIPAQYHGYLEKIGIAGKNLLTLVNTILDFAKLEAGKLQFRPEQSNTYMVIKEVLAVTEPLAHKKAITLNYPSFTSHVLFMDPQLIKQVLTNLLSNAIKFTPEGGEVKLNAVFNADGEFHFSVCDNGVGIPLASQAKLFEPFSQVDNPFQKSVEGTGLGLAISKKIVEDLHDGRIWVESEEGKGSCFHVTLPFQKNDVFVERVTLKGKDVKNLLIVEDTRDYINILVEGLKKRYNITVTNSINEAKILLDNEHFDIGIYDFFLIDGISTELLTFMEQSYLDFPVLVISAEQDHDLMVSFQASSFVEGIFSKEYINDVLAALTAVDR